MLFEGVTDFTLSLHYFTYKLANLMNSEMFNFTKVVRVRSFNLRPKS